MQLARSRLAGDRGQLAFGWAVAHDEQATEPLVEVREALEQELGARAGGVAAAQQPVVEAEHRHDVAPGVERRAQRGLVVHAQVAREPQQRGHATGRVPRPAAIARAR